MATTFRKPPPEDAPFTTIIDPKGRKWNTVSADSDKPELWEGASGTLLLPPPPTAGEDGIARGALLAEAHRMMALGRLRYPFPISDAEVEELGASGFLVELVRRILTTSALHAKGLPVLMWANAECQAYVKGLFPVIANALHVDDGTAQRLGMMLTAEACSGASSWKDSAVSDLIKKWQEQNGHKQEAEGQPGEGEAEGQPGEAAAADDISSQTLRDILKNLVSRGEPKGDDGTRQAMRADEWFKKVKDIRSWDFGNGFLPPYLTDIIPGYSPGLDWVKPKLEKPPTKATKISMSRGLRVSDTGAIPRLMHRLPMDGRVFAVKRKNVGGSVLIDCSGSMGVTQEQILQIAKHFPAGIVAGYSGDRLVVMADRGRVITGSPGKWKGTNECDGPALEWLLRQGSPRFWVSDGAVTLRGDSLSKAGMKHCEALRKWGNIERIPTINAALERISKLMKAGGQKQEAA